MKYKVEICGIEINDRVPITRGQLETLIDAVITALDYESRQPDITTTTIRVVMDDGYVVVDVTDRKVLYRSNLLRWPT